jgi:thymidine kinase
MTVGYLELIIGPMFSGKTTALIDIYEKNTILGKNLYVVNYSGDTRYHESMLSTHDKKMIPCVFASKLSELFLGEVVLDAHNADVILINEGQFFPDLYQIVKLLVEDYGKHVYVCGLDGDFKRHKFGQLLDLIPLSDNVKKLHSNCKFCNNNAIFSHRITNEIDQVVIGSSNYHALCRACYNKNNSVKT